MRQKSKLIFGLLAVTWPSLPASAERLYTPWKLQPTAGTLVVDAIYGQPFLEQRLLPVRAASLTADVSVDGTVVAKAGSPLFLVYNERQQTGFCTRKNFSTTNQFKTLFIPVLDRRPCFVDQDGNGKFDAVFFVFDKFGSGATPSGDLHKARALPSEVSYAELDPHEFPVPLRLSFQLQGSRKPEKVGIQVRFDKSGTGAWAYWKGDFPRLGNAIQALNTRIEIRAVQNGRADINLRLDPEVHLIGESTGFSAAPLPPFLSR